MHPAGSVSIESVSKKLASLLPVPCQYSHAGSELVFSVIVRLFSGTR